MQPPPSSEPDTALHSWFAPSLPRTDVMQEAKGEEAFARLWHSFMSARVLVALAIGLLQLIAHLLGQPLHAAVPLLCIGYLAATVALRLLARPRRPGRAFAPQWPLTAGVDLLVYSLLQLLQQPGALNYTPLFALPLLLVSVLGSLRLALASAAAITLLLLAGAWWGALGAADDAAARLLAAGLTGSGYFLVALLVNQLASRLAREQRRSRRSHIAASLQSQVNELVIDALADGVAVLDRDGIVRAANPAARLLLGSARGGGLQIPFALAVEPAWWPLLDRVHDAFNAASAPEVEVLIQHAGQGQRRLRVRTRLTASSASSGGSLCVVFLHDLRETEARLRTEKLAAMGRMSSAVAHEIRNPLAAIVQANALLEEDIQDPAQKRLIALVRQNAQRLARITEEVLDISRVQRQLDGAAQAALALDPALRAICDEWSAQRKGEGAPHLALSAGSAEIRFDPEHLRRVLINLLDNGRRHARPHPDSLQVTSDLSQEEGQPRLSVWSEGSPLEPAVEQHLFEPFFSSQSRSTGLGLYICRELCERHRAQIGYRREPRMTARGEAAGNAFIVAFAPVAAQADQAGLLEPDIDLSRSTTSAA